MTGRVKDWYEVLGIDTNSHDSAINAAIERMSRLASALANTAPDRSQDVRETIRAIRRDLCSGLDARQAYDQQLARSKTELKSEPLASESGNVVPSEIPGQVAPPPFYAGTQNPQSRHDGQAVSESPPSVVDAVVANLAPVVSRFRRFIQSGWSCPTCGSEGRPGDEILRQVRRVHEDRTFGHGYQIDLRKLLG